MKACNTDACSMWVDAGKGETRQNIYLDKDCSKWHPALRVRAMIVTEMIVTVRIIEMVIREVQEKKEVGCWEWEIEKRWNWEGRSN